MAISAATAWRIRVAGNNANGGGYDATIGGAGTDYTDQDAAQLSLADIVTNGTTTVTSVTGGFTAAMIGNCLRIAGDGYYFITARASTNSITVDRATGTGTGQSGKVGGAFADLTNFFTGGSLPQPSLASPAVPGNIIYMRGAGSNDPIVDDYTYNPSQYAQSTNGDITNGKIRIIGYNGRPRINYGGLLAYQTNHIVIENLVLVLNASAAYSNYGFFGTSVLGNIAINVKVDTNGVADSGGLSVLSAINCLVTNSGTVSSGSGVGISLTQYGGVAIGCRVEKMRGTGIFVNVISSVMHCLVLGNGNSGVSLSGGGGYGATLANCTIDGNASHGVTTDAVDLTMMSIFNNNITANGGYGIYVASGSPAVTDRLKCFVDYNNFGTGTTANTSGAYHNIGAGPNDLNVDPQYTGGNAYIPTNAALQGTAFPGALP